MLRQRLSVGGLPQARLALVLPTVIALTVVAYLVALLLNARGVLDSVYAHADASAPLVMAELLPDAPSNLEVVLGDYSWIEALWILRGTAWLPSHYAVWQLLPFLSWFGIVALAAGSVRLVASRTSALLTAAVLICVGYGARLVVWTLNFHGLVMLHTALLAFWLTWLATRPQWLRRRRSWVVAIALGLVTAAGVQDQMLLAVGVLPFLVTGALWSWRVADWRPVALIGVTVVIAVGGGAFLHHLATEAGIIRDEREFVFTPGGQLLDHVGIMIGALGELVSGKSLGNLVSAVSVVALLGMLLAVLVTVVIAWQGYRTARTLAERDTPALAPADLVLVFWATVILATFGSWMLSGFVADVTDVRYLGSLWIGLAVGLGLLAQRRGAMVWAQAAVAGMCLYATIGVLHQIKPTSHSNFPLPRAAAAVRSFALAHGAKIGYAGNWDAFPLTWHTRFAVTLTPLQSCYDPADPTINCPPPQHRISSWYHERPHSPRSFLVLDTSQPQNPVLDPRYGKPLAGTTYGTMQVYVFKYDIARDVRPPGTRPR
jgi:uncharacterized membrane protein SirB2